ncbi:UPF0310 protein YdcG [Frankliniella fusca]|uniref:UPF0310 protein YdcG n=1 Tax=Frankliniella fusca TaxID=407009 RepID=A0AAE1H6M8_9NEOP|nr:UPF0310 protein YdcG [Frankliniella fusca]
MSLFHLFHLRFRSRPSTGRLRDVLVSSAGGAAQVCHQMAALCSVEYENRENEWLLSQAHSHPSADLTDSLNILQVGSLVND